MIFFGLAYFAHGIAGGLAKQPFTNYFKSLGMTADMVAAWLSLAAVPWMICPPRAAGFAFASLMSIYSATAQIAAIMGGYLYEWVFHQQLIPLIYLAALCTLGALAWIPFFPAPPTCMEGETSDESRHPSFKRLPA